MGWATCEGVGVGLDKTLWVAWIESWSKCEDLHTSQWSHCVGRIAELCLVKQMVNKPIKTRSIHMEWTDTWQGQEICTSNHWWGDVTRFEEIPGGWIISTDSHEGWKGYFTNHYLSLVASWRILLHAILESNIFQWAQLIWCFQLLAEAFLTCCARILILNGWIQNWQGWDRNL